MTNTEVDRDGRYLPTTAIMLELQQFDKLRQIEPPLTIEDLAQRMAWTKEEVLWLLRKFRDNTRRRRSVLNEHIVELKQRKPNMTYGQIANQLGTTVGTVSGAIARYKERVALGRAQ